nr:MAG TPA: hypothetical protein [Bacteriophage sp.]
MNRREKSPRTIKSGEGILYHLQGAKKGQIYKFHKYSWRNKYNNTLFF